MRLKVAGLRGAVKGDWAIEFSGDRLTSYAGLELLRRFLRTLGFFDQLRVAERTCRLRGDFSFRATVLLMVGMLFVGARRLRHVEFLRNDPLLLRFVGLSRMPSERSLSRKLKNMTWRTWPALDMLSHFTVRAATQQLDAKRWTLDVDGSVLTTGLSVEQAKRGFNPHHRKNPSYYRRRSGSFSLAFLLLSSTLVTRRCQDRADAPGRAPSA